MRATKPFHFVLLARWRQGLKISLLIGSFLLIFSLIAACGATTYDLKVMKMGLGSGAVTSSTGDINCGADCDETYSSAVSVTLTATADPGSTFLKWDGDCSGASSTCTITVSAARSVRAVFDLSPVIPSLNVSEISPVGIQAYLTANPTVTSAARFINALPAEYKQNWILMSRSESLQTGTAELPRILLPSANAQNVFTLGLATHSSYPGAHPNAIEYMQWDSTDKNFRFHEIVLDSIPAMGGVPARSRGVSVDDVRCSKCHSTQNVLNSSPYPGTSGIPPGSIQVKNKPNWDSYDSWGGMMPFNRDRIYQGSVEAAAFRKIFNPWTWRTNDTVRSIIEQLELQPPGVPAAHLITRTNGGPNDGHVNFVFDTSPPVLTEPPPSSSGTGPEAPIITSYSFDGQAGTGTATSVTRGGAFVTLHHSNIPGSDEGRAVRLFDALGGLAGTLNQQRIADEVINHRFATGNVPVDVRPITLAISKSCLSINSTTDTVTSTTTTPLTVDLAFFNARNGTTINDLIADTRSRAQSLPLRKADIQKLNPDRMGDVYLFVATNGLIPQYGSFTSVGLDTSLNRLRQEVFRRPNDLGVPDATVMGGIYVDREVYAYNTNRLALYRYFLEPLGVSVDKWSMGVRGRSRTYTFADVFSTYANVFEPELEASLTSDPVSGLSTPFDCASLIPAVNTTLGSLPPANAVPTYTDVQRIFNKSCIECHGGLGYPPYGVGLLDLSEDENPPSTTPVLPNPRLASSYTNAFNYTSTDPATSYLFDRITRTSEACGGGMMPCGGPPLSNADIETIRRWIIGPPSRPATLGDPHITTVEGIHYDFQAAGEFVLLRDEGIEIQARQTAVSTDGPLGPNGYTGLTSCVSVNSAVAVRIGSERITYQPNPNRELNPEGLQLRVNGKLVQMSSDGIALDNGGRIIPSTAPGGIQIEASGGGSTVIVTPGWWDHYQLWYLNIDTRFVRATQGVMGALAPGSWLPALPDGSSLGPKPANLQQRYEDLYDHFGKAWRVNDSTSLFDYSAGSSTGTYTIESWPNGESPESCLLPLETPGPLGNPPLKALTVEEAVQYCQGILDEQRRDNCLQDVMVTGEPGFAATYLLHQEIESNAVPTTPELLSPEDNSTQGGSVRFTWNLVSDADGDAITYRHCLWSLSESPNHNTCEVVQSQPTKWNENTLYVLVVVLLGCLFLVVLIARGIKKRPALLMIVAALMVAAVIITYRLGSPIKDSPIISRSVTGLESGQIYYWKVFAEDGKGGTIESQTRSFTIR